ncbi:MAG: DUF3089 domain-containing protein [Bacteroidota bacterium]
MPRLLYSLTLVYLFWGCASAPRSNTFLVEDIPAPPNYERSKYWAALPTSEDQADRTPTGLNDRQYKAKADVFYVHPTIYLDTRRGNRAWNANLADEKLNESVEETAILNQASIFNSAGKVFAPRYRQAHLAVFQPKHVEAMKPALDLAYTDVLAAFDYFLAHLNEGRPIIIAAHSQGTLHATRLLQDRFDGKDLQNKLIAAYLVGMPIRKDQFSSIPVCEAPEQTACFLSWRTYREDYVPESRDTTQEAVVVNPLNWTTKTGLVPATENKGAVLYNFEKILPELVGAEIKGPRLYTNKPRFFGDIFFNRKNYHIGDYNLFWMNIRENAVARVKAFLAKQ